MVRITTATHQVRRLSTVASLEALLGYEEKLLILDAGAQANLEALLPGPDGWTRVKDAHDSAFTLGRRWDYQDGLLFGLKQE